MTSSPTVAGMPADAHHTRFALLARFAASAMVAFICSFEARAETVYISDKLTVPLRSGPSNQHRILHAGLVSGTEMEVMSVDDEAGFTQIRTSRGTEGWVRSQYLVATPIARAQLADATRRIANLERQLARSSSSQSTVQSERDEAQQTNAQLSRDLEKVTKELDEVKRISAGAIAEHSNNQKLGQLNQRLRDEVDALLVETSELESNQRQQWMLIGAALLLIGLVIGLVVKSRPRRSGWS